MLRTLFCTLVFCALPADAQISWCPLAEGGFGDGNNLLAGAYAEYRGLLYVGTLNPLGAELFTHDGQGFLPVAIPGFSSDNIALTCGLVHQGNLLLGTWNDVNGAEVWRFDGTSWTQVASGGFGSGSAAPAIDQLAIFQNKLYAAVADQNRGSRVLEFQSPGNWIQRNPDGFGCGSANAEVYGLREYAGQLYASANNNTGSQLWRWNGSGTWTRVDPGGSGCNAGGFGSGGLDTGIHALAVAGTTAALYVGTENAAGCEVWRYDGAWLRIATAGFGDPGNFIVHDLESLGGVLYAATEHQNSGCEVWAYELQSGTWLRVDPGAPTGEGGFGAGSDNSLVYELATYQGRLLATTLNGSDGAEVWRLGIGTPYCSATSNSSGGAASLCAEGSLSVSAANLVLTSTPVPNSNGIFFHGANAVQLPFGNGFLCASGGIQRGAVVGAAGNRASYTYDGSGPKHSLVAWAGSTRNFQHWFRDTMGGGAFYNTSNGVRLALLP